MFTRQFWTLTAERAVKVFAESLGAYLLASGAGLFGADWRMAASTAGMATLLSVLTSLASAKVGPADSPSVVRTGPAPVPPAAPPAAAPADPAPAGPAPVPAVPAPALAAA